ncbi:thioredoxin family protein [Siphonobacter curvatus]|uniref:Thioredoxin domain-containing protein n=1 Tax=Siphonobacter curvatus TaxID=2094562 RepID=A0A2S7IQ90_9BACT|nr:thioredoxin family protein [Siphonobacter curvatus]PQA59875.1 hypothetical protein C5O19_09705 [Siphonobacter curvatus]
MGNLKKALLIGWFSLLMGSVWAQGVSFVLGNLRTPFTQAKAQKKAVFVEVYSPTCHVCESFKPTFQQASVGAAYNARFVSYKLDINSPEAQAFLAKQHLVVPSLPLFLFFDADVKLLHAQNVSNSAKEVIGVANTALDATKRGSAYANRFKKGERSTAFLLEYGSFTRIVRDTVANVQVMQAYAKALPSSAYTSKPAFTALQNVVMDAENPLFTYFISHLAVYKGKYPPQEVTKAGESIVMNTLYAGRAAFMAPERIQKIGSYLTTLGLDAKSVENRTLIPDLNALVRAQRWGQLLDRINRYEKVGGPGPAECSYLASYLRSKSNNPQILQKAAALASRGNR